jgi:glycerol-1-phosphate dehydrogenase [NAD(P)+]
MQHLFDTYTGFDRLGEDGVHYTTFTQVIAVEPAVELRLPAILDQVAEPGPVALVFDANTWRVAGQAAHDALVAAGRGVVLMELMPRTGNDAIVCDDAHIAIVRNDLADVGVRHAVAVGAGTINDIVKMAAFQVGIAYTTIATAPSMNGYTSSIAAILSDGVKTTQPCQAPIAALADPRVMAEAPYRMIASGIGDLYSKPVSNADWRLSHRLLGTTHSTIVMEIVEAGSSLLDGVAALLPKRDLGAVERLTGALMLSGLAMQAAGTSGPASGGEHLVSHFIDMTSIAFGESHDFHGCQVAVGTVAMSRLYERVRALDPARIDVDALVARHPTWEQWEQVVQRRFGTLAESVLPHAQKMYPARDDVRTRLNALVANWSDIFDDVGTTLRSSAALEAELRAAECPTRFPEIDVTADRAWRALVHCKDIRARYTILHLASELGVLDAFASDYVDESFAITA